MRQKEREIVGLLSKYNQNREMKVIDIGARDKLIKNELPGNMKYTSLDVDSSFKPDIVGDIEKRLPIKDKSYDFIVCSEVLEHVIYPRRVLKEFRRILKDDGKIIITLPNEYNLNHRIQFLLGIQKGCEVPFKEKIWMIHIHRPRVIDSINFFKSGFKLKEVVHAWDSDKKISRIVDPIVRILLMPLSKNLFTTSTVMLGTKR